MIKRWHLSLKSKAFWWHDHALCEKHDEHDECMSWTSNEWTYPKKKKKKHVINEMTNVWWVCDECLK